MAVFGEKLRRFRKSAGRTQGELGKLVGVPQATISKWEKGLQRPSAEHANRLQNLIGVPIGELLGLEVRTESKAAPNQGFAEMKQSGFNEPPPGDLVTDSNKNTKLAHHPAFGIWKGLVTLDPHYDYTQPADPDWGKVYER